MRAGLEHCPKADGCSSDDDLALVSRACRCLDVLDFEFFRIAWRTWYGSEPDDAAIEPGFVAYLFHQRAPGYVRQFARRTVADDGSRQARATQSPAKPPVLEAIGSAGIFLMTMVMFSIVIRL